LDRHEAAAFGIMAQVYGTAKETRWLANWGLFFLICGQVWRVHSGREFLV
jgi:hypothetical protein